MYISKPPSPVHSARPGLDVDAKSGTRPRPSDLPPADPSPPASRQASVRERSCKRLEPPAAGAPLMQLARRVAAASCTRPRDLREMSALLEELAELRRSHQGAIRAADLAHAMAGLVPQATPTAREVHEVLRRIRALVGEDGFGIRECLRVGASLPHRLPRGEAYELPAGTALHVALGRTLVSHVFQGLAASREAALTPEETGRALADLLRHEHFFGIGHARAVLTALAERTGGDFPQVASVLGRHLGDKLSMHMFTMLEDLLTRAAGGQDAPARPQALTAMLTGQTPWPVIIRAAVRFRCRPGTAVITASFTRELGRSRTAGAQQLREVLDVEPCASERARNYIELANTLVHAGRLPEGTLGDGLLDRAATLALADALLAAPPSPNRPSLMAQLPVLCQARADADLLLALADRLGRLPELTPSADRASDETELTTAALVSDLLNAACLRLSPRTLAPADRKRADEAAGPGPGARTHHCAPAWITDDLRRTLTERLETATAAVARPAAARRDDAPGEETAETLSPPIAPAAAR